MRCFHLARSLALATLIGGSFAVCHAEDVKLNDATLGKAAPEGALVLIGDGDSLDQWVKASWPVEDGVATVKGGAIRTEKKFGDFQLHVEFNIPYMPKAHGQARGNSGVYLDGTYELQVLDSYGLKPKNNDCGAIYTQIAPSVNACKPPLQWQTYDVTFHKAKVEDGKTVKKARVTVIQNGVKIIDDAEISPTPGGVGTKEGEDGPIMLQDHGNPVQYRNIWIKPLG